MVHAEGHLLPPYYALALCTSKHQNVKFVGVGRNSLGVVCSSQDVNRIGKIKAWFDLSREWVSGQKLQSAFVLRI
jgi:hypothetical protein